MFGQNWKYHDEDEIDEDTLPEKKNCESVEKCIEAMALSEIVMEVHVVSSRAIYSDMCN